MAIHACGHVATGLVNELFSREGDRGVQFRPMASSPKHPAGPAMTLGNMAGRACITSLCGERSHEGPSDKLQ
jgi:hypothetical protein